MIKMKHSYDTLLRLQNQRVVGPQELVNEGMNSSVYRLPGKRVIKIPKFNFTNEDIQKEYERTKIIYEAGIPVPKPITVRSIRVEREPETLWEFLTGGKIELKSGFEMEYINGKHRDILTPNEVYEKRKKEIEKAEELGFIPHDIHEGNWMKTWDGRIVFLDVGSWGIPKQVEETA